MDVARTTRSPRRTAWIVGGAIAVVLVIAVLVGAWLVRPAEVTAATPTPTPTATQTPTPTPTPTPTGFAANTAVYESTGLPQVNVFAVIPDLPVDEDPFAAFTGEEAHALGEGAPVFADPEGEPVAYLLAELPYDGTTVPVVERQSNWVKVLFVGRQAVPSKGDPSQVSGWMRAQDVAITPATTTVEVSLADRTIDIVRDGKAERIATDFGSGTEHTPTPTGRTFIMTTDVVEEFWYTRGHPIVYLAVQSPTMDGFGGADVAITAFHYHDARSGAISNGCIRVDPSAIEKLAELPLGTPVIINP